MSDTMAKAIAKTKQKESTAKVEENEYSIRDIPGIGPSVVKKLTDAGFHSAKSLAVATEADLFSIKGLGETTVKKILFTVREQYDLGLRPGGKYKEQSEHRLRLKTSSEDLDRILGGGVECGSVTEFYGAFRTGKTQICYQLAINAQLPHNKGGLEKKVLWIDTEGTFYWERPYAIAKELGLDPDHALDNITVGRAYNSDHQMALTEHCFQLADETREYGLIIIDSLMANFRCEYVGRGTLATRQQKIGKHLHYILRQTHIQQIATIVTNQVQAKPDQLFGDPNQPIGGNVVGHMVTHRIKLQKASKNIRKATMIDSPSLPEDDAQFQILPIGIRDA
ncbi:MAG: DNA repair and recombination protein RadA [Candidatus Hodarchaeota archaeon]